MKYLRRFGNDRISKIGLGTGRFGTLVEENLAFQMLDRFVEKGGNVIDTARNYYEWVDDGRGVSERTIGRWMKLRNHREDIIVCTKGGVRNKDRVFFPNLSRENLLNELSESLDALDTDYINIYLLHRDEPYRDVGEIAETLTQIREIASCSAVGVSNWTFERLVELDEYIKTHNLPALNVVQMWWSIADYTYEMWNDPTTTGMNRDFYNYFLDNDKIVMASTSQSKGFFQKAIRNGINGINSKLRERVASVENLRRLSIIKEYCERFDVSPTAVVSSYITDNDLQGIALVSCSSLEQLDDVLNNSDTVIDRDWSKQFDPK